MTKSELQAIGWTLISPDFICNREWTISRSYNIYNDTTTYLLAKGAIRHGQFESVEKAIEKWESVK